MVETEFDLELAEKKKRKRLKMAHLKNEIFL